jgi:copper chaperone CopZ
MNKSLKYMLIAIVVLSSTVCNAQTKNQKTETVKIYGNCGMCESTIEKAGDIKNVSEVDWDKDTKMATISYDSLKTSKEEILKRIALAGYDSDTFLAPDDTYSNLPSCCQYERVIKAIAKTEEENMEVATNNHSMHSKNMTEMQETNPLSAVYEGYFAVMDALVETNGTSVSANAKILLSAIKEVKMEKLEMDVHMVWMKVLEPLEEKAQAMSGTEDVEKQRSHLDALSKNIYELMKISTYETPTYFQFCPMANNGKGANWLSKEETIKNPYYGSQMLSCGKTVETIRE